MASEARHTMRRKGVIAMLGFLVAAAGILAPALAATRASMSYTLDPSLHLKRVRVSAGPEQIRVLTLTHGVVPDIAPATQQYPMWALTSTMSAHAGAIAGVNGDFGTGKGQPVHTLMIDGELWTTGQAQGRAVAWSSNGSQAYIGHPALHIRASDRQRCPVQHPAVERARADHHVDRRLYLARRRRDQAPRQGESGQHRPALVRGPAGAGQRDRLERRRAHLTRPQVLGAGAARAVRADPHRGRPHVGRGRGGLEVLDLGDEQGGGADRWRHGKAQLDVRRVAAA